MYLKNAVNDEQNFVVHNLEFTRRKSLNYEPSILSRNVTFKNMGNITKISWPNVDDFLNDEVLQNIFRYLTLLKHIMIPSLYYKSNFPITDYGFTGESSENLNQIGYPISNLTNLRSFNFFDQTTCLGDRTLFHFSKLKQLRFLKISCKNVCIYILVIYVKLIVFFFKGSKGGYQNLIKCCPLLKAVCVVLHPSSYN